MSDYNSPEAIEARARAHEQACLANGQAVAAICGNTAAPSVVPGDPKSAAVAISAILEAKALEATPPKNQRHKRGRHTS